MTIKNKMLVQAIDFKHDCKNGVEVRVTYSTSISKFITHDSEEDLHMVAEQLKSKLEERIRDVVNGSN